MDWKAGVDPDTEWGWAVVGVKTPKLTFGDPQTSQRRKTRCVHACIGVHHILRLNSYLDTPFEKSPPLQRLQYSTYISIE